jgi:Flp pilus assembly protein TadG
MRVSRRRPFRRGAVLIEVAVILPVLVMIIFAAIDTASGVYRYQQVATLAREGARYASVHAGMYAEEKGTSVPTAVQIQQAAVTPKAVNLDSSKLTCTLTWVNGTSYPFTVTNDTGQRKVNNVRYSVSYQWKSLFLLGSEIKLTSTSELPISY